MTVHRAQCFVPQVVSRRIALLGVGPALLTLFAQGCKRDNSGNASAIASRQGLTPEGNPNPTQDDRCPMCAMAVATNPNWVGAIALRSGDTFYTCSVRCTLATSMMPDKFLGVPVAQIERVRVPDYLHANQWLDADKAWYVIDSNVRGPMGLSLVPAGSEQDAATIVERHRGRVLQRNEITIPVLQDLKKRNSS